eukprot:3534702-Rhodomonas_salina.1
MRKSYPHCREDASHLCQYAYAQPRKEKKDLQLMPTEPCVLLLRTCSTETASASCRLPDPHSQ